MGSQSKQWFGPESIKEASAGMSCLDFFMLMFPPNHLLKIFQLKNTQLAKVRQRETNWKEILKFFSVLVLMTRFEFVSRSSLWLTFANCVLVSWKIFRRWFGGNINIKKSRRDIPADTSLFDGLRTKPLLALTPHYLS